MTGIRIKDMGANRVLAFDLRDILRLLGEDAITSTWTASCVECTGPNSEQLHESSDRGEKIEGARLFAITEGIGQVIDGDFSGDLDGDTPWITIRAVDSSFFEVITDRSAVIETLRARFKVTEEIPREDLV